MSEALGKNGIEDVLSSVRRLVSPDARPRVVSRELRLDKLMLTPSLQVTPEAPRADTLVLTDRAVDVDEGPVGLSSDPAQDTAVPDDVPPAVADAAEVDVAAADADVPVAEPLADAAPDVALHVVEGEWEDAFWSEPEQALAEIALGAEEAEVVAADPAPWAQEERAWPEAEPAAAAAKSPLMEGLEGLTDADGNPVTVLDEAALNEIVRALIREELQGVLGERITQNVRKLVRAEINRALTARSLD
jgi:hypothetical protein